MLASAVCACVLGLTVVAGAQAPVRTASAAAVQPSPLAIPATDEGLPGAGPIRRYDWFQKLWLQRPTQWAALATLGVLETQAEPFTPDEGFESLFNGRDLTGWGYRPTSEADMAAAKRWQASDPNAAAWPFVTKAERFDGLTESPDGRFRAIDGRLVVTAPPEGRRIQQLWTIREFGDDFILTLEFRATPNADSGLYLRGPQLQVRDYRVAGPYRNLARYKPQDWNELVVTVRGGLAVATCNGELLEAAFKVPESGPIGVEGDRGQMEYRRLQIKPRAQ